MLVFGADLELRRDVVDDRRAGFAARTGRAHDGPASKSDAAPALLSRDKRDRNVNPLLRSRTRVENADTRAERTRERGRLDHHDVRPRDTTFRNLEFHVAEHAPLRGLPLAARRYVETDGRTRLRGEPQRRERQGQKRRSARHAAFGGA